MTTGYDADDSDTEESDTEESQASIDARGATGVQVGNYNTQITYTYDPRTWTDQVAPPPLVDVSGVIESPYRGLGAFEERDSPFFFGRESATRELLALMSRRLTAPALVVVSGVSGAGKSSLLRAGVLPSMRGAGLAGAPGSATWPCLVFTPGRNPLDQLAMRVASLVGTDAASLRQRLADDPTGFALIAGQLAESADRRMLFVVDQFEQVFTQCSDVDQRQAFVTALHAAANVPAALVVLVVRADFEARCADYPELVAAVRDRYLVTSMTRRQLEMAITEPAKRAGSGVDDDVVKMLVRDALAGAGGAPSGVLPLLSHVLDQAWRGRAGPELTVADYERAGGIERAVADSAQRAYERLTPAQQTATRQVFIRLTATNSEGVDTADRAALAELTQGKSDDEAADVRAVLESFAAERLLTLAAGTVEISHEVLLSAWPLLRDTWLAETHSDRIVRTRLRTTAAEWDHAGKDPSYLYGGSLLETATSTAARAATEPARQPPLSDDERAFLRESERAHRRRARARQGVLAFLMALVVGLAAVSVVAYRSGQEAVHQRDLSVAGQLISQSQNLGDSDPTGAKLDSLAAWALTPTADARYAMRVAAARPLRRILSLFNGGSGVITSVTFEGDGKTLITADFEGIARRWDVATGRPAGQFGGISDNHSRIWSVAVSQDGKIMATATEDGTVRLRDAATGQQLGQPLPAPPTTNVTFSPDGKTLATIGLGGTVRAWDVATRHQIGPAPTAKAGAFATVALSPDGRTMAFADGGGTVQLWAVATGQPIGQPLATLTAQAQSVAFSPNGKILAAVGKLGAVRLLDVTTGAQVGQPFTGAVASVSSVAFSPDGTVFAVVSDDGTVRLMRVATGFQIGPTLAGPPGGVLSAVFSPDGATLAVASLDGTVRLWRVAIGRRVGQPAADPAGTYSSMAFSPDGRTLATASQGGTVWLWNAATGDQVGPPLDGHADPQAVSVVFSPDGRTLAVAGIDGTARLWDVATGRQIEQFGGGKLAVTSVEFGPGGRTLATGSLDGTARLWDVGTGRQIEQFGAGLQAAILSMALSPGGKTLAIARAEAPMELWDVATGQRKLRLSDATQSSDLVVFSPDGRTLATGSSDTTARLWDVATGSQVGQPFTNYSGGITSVAFSPDGRTLAVASEDGPPVLWDVATGGQIGPPLASGTRLVYGLSFSPDGKTLATAGIGAARLWNVDYLVDVQSQLCRDVGGSFTPTMWAKYVPQGPVYRNVCP